MISQLLAQNSILVVALAMVAAGGVFYAVAYPLLSGEAKMEKRKAAISERKRVGRAADRSADPNARRKQIADSLKELDAKQKSKRLTIETKLQQAGVATTKTQFLIYSVLGGLALAIVFVVLSGNPLYALGGVLIGGFGLPAWGLNFLRKRRINKFTTELPNAMDVIVRGIKAGLPLGDCLRIIASEAADPVRTEFRMIVEAQSLGLSLGEAVERMAERVPAAEANFFSIVVNIQSKSGGNLSEALGNLSRVLRERKKMRGKVTAMSMEAKASAAIIGALPFIVGLLVYLSTPAYMELLFTSTTGKIVMAVSLFWMFIGLMAMRKMIQFDI
jgi:tight adherence protein B